MKSFPALAVLILTGLSSCTLFSTERIVTIEIPPLPEGLEESGRGLWNIEMCSTSGQHREKQREWQNPLPERMELEWPKNEDLLVLLTPPQWSPGIGPYPCGAYLSTDDGGGDLRWKDGAAVSVLSRVIGAGGDLEGFNCPRFLEEMDRMDNPWLADQELLARQLGRREMRSWYIREAALFPVSITLPEGEWYFQYVLQSPFVSIGEPAEISLSEGYISLFCPEKGNTAELQLDDHGDLFWMFASAGSFH